MIHNKSVNICIIFLKILKKKSENKTVNDRIKKAFKKFNKDLKIKKKITETDDKKNINTNADSHRKLINFFKKLTELNEKFTEMCRDVTDQFNELKQKKD